MLRERASLILDGLTGDWREAQPQPDPPPAWSVWLSTFIVACMFAIGCGGRLPR